MLATIHELRVSMDRAARRSEVNPIPGGLTMDGRQDDGPANC
jgi:hypothetical protein